MVITANKKALIIDVLENCIRNIREENGDPEHIRGVLLNVVDKLYCESWAIDDDEFGECDA